jgi:hypothetical protein
VSALRRSRIRQGWVLLLVVAGVMPVRGAELGRLFLRPEERAALQLRREQSPIAASDDVPAVTAVTASDAEAPRAVAPVIVNGVVLRRNGSGTVWVNGVNDYDGDPARLPAAVRPLPGGRVRIRIDAPQREIELRPGQVYDPESDRIHDSFRDSGASR